MVSCELKFSMAIAGRGARACDMCGKERARWYCAADEAYLCERCDGSVHSANAVARRHERVKLGPNGAPVKLKPSHSHHRKSKTDCSPATGKSNPSSHLLKGPSQKWCSTSTRKRARTPRKGANSTGHSLFTTTPMATLAECLDTALIKEEKDETFLLYDLLTADDHVGDVSGEIPTFDVKKEPFSPSSTLTSKDALDPKAEEVDFSLEVPTYEPLLQDLIASSDENLLEKLMPSSPSVCNASCTSRSSNTTDPGTMGNPQACPADTELRDLKCESIQLCADAHAFDAAEGSTIELNDSISINEDSDIDTFDVMDLCSSGNFDENMKVDEELPDMEIWKAAYRLDEGACASVFDGNPFKGKGEREVEGQGEEGKCLQQWPPQQQALKKPLSLQLDYEDVINSWSGRGSLWMDGQRPQIVPDICCLDHGNMDHHGLFMVGESSCNSSMCSQAGQVPCLVVTDKGREARVLRYKEKRRTRLFSKKIRYEVRKLNAERRPRMKGRFVKRAAIAAM